MMTPAAKPRKMRCAEGLSRRTKKTIAEPSVVMSQVKPQPSAAHSSACPMFQPWFSPHSLVVVGAPGRGGRDR